MLVLPIRTESDTRRTPLVNYGLIGVNMLLFFLLDEGVAGKTMASFGDRVLAFHSDSPAFHQFFTYQFVHAGPMHVLGNMLFLWVFGNSVNGKMGGLPYLLFYLAGGVFAAWGYALVRTETFHLVGASGAIASITTAYLVLFPRSRVTVLVWLFFIYFFEVSAMIIIGFKIIVWDNIVAPLLAGSGDVAHSAHLAGYVFGFVGALGLLLVRAIPRDQFDILALWKRWNQRRQFAAAMAQPGAAERARYGDVARSKPDEQEAQVALDECLDEVSDLRKRIGESLEQQNLDTATALYEELLAVDPRQCLSEREQLAIAREFYSTRRFAQAATSFDLFIQFFPRSTELGNVTLLVGIIYARDLRQYEAADQHLTRTWETLRDDKRRRQCFGWLSDVRAALGRPAPEI